MLLSIDFIFDFLECSLWVINEFDKLYQRYHECSWVAYFSLRFYPLFMLILTTLFEILYYESCYITNTYIQSHRSFALDYFIILVNYIIFIFVFFIIQSSELYNFYIVFF
jgi:hypothetical protein